MLIFIIVVNLIVYYYQTEKYIYNKIIEYLLTVTPFLGQCYLKNNGNKENIDIYSLKNVLSISITTKWRTCNSEKFFFNFGNILSMYIVDNVCFCSFYILFFLHVYFVFIKKNIIFFSQI